MPTQPNRLRWRYVSTGCTAAFLLAAALLAASYWLRPGSPAALSVPRQVVLTDLRDPDGTIRDSTAAIAIHPDDAAAYSNRGLAYLAKGEAEKAVRDYTQAISLNPRWEFAFRLRGDAYAKLREWGKAIADYTQALRISPTPLAYHRAALHMRS